MVAKNVLRKNRRPTRDPQATAKRDNAASFMSNLTGASKKTSTNGRPLTQIEVEKLYRSNWVCRKVCDLYASDMVAAGVEWSMDAEKAEFLERKFRDLQVWSALEQAIKLARLYGGSIVYMATETTGTDKPLNEGEKIVGLRVFDRYEAKPDTMKLVATGARIGEPQAYDIQPVITTDAIKADESRCLRFIGAALPANLAKNEDLWGDSVLQSMANRVEIFDNATEGVGELMARCYLRTIGIKDFWNAMGDDDPLQSEMVAKGISMLNQLQTIYGLTVMDAEDTFSSQQYSFGGVKDVLDQIGQQLAGACDVPLVRLYGMSPAGFSTGESDLKSYYGAILKAQESMLRGPITRIARQLLLSEGKDASELDFKFVPLNQPTQAEKIATANQGVQTILAVNGATLISDARALEEIRRLSETTGLFGTVDEADIDALKTPDLPAMDDPTAGDMNNGPIQP